MAQALEDLAAAQVSVWLDDLSRPRIQTGSLARMVERGDIVGITTNPTIFAKAIGAGSGYEDQLRDLALRGTAIGETLRLLTAWDVRAACASWPNLERLQADRNRIGLANRVADGIRRSPGLELTGDDHVAARHGLFAGPSRSCVGAFRCRRAGLRNCRGLVRQRVVRLEGSQPPGSDG
jgi:hypothetical protein